MGGAAVFTSGAVGAGAAELAVEGDVRAGEGAEGELACGKVDAKAAIGGVTEFNVEVFSSISARALLGVNMGCSLHGGWGGRLLGGNVGYSRVCGQGDGVEVCEGGDGRGVV